MIATVWGRQAFFCTPACRDSFREDLKQGLIYEACKLGDSFVSPQEYSIYYDKFSERTCCYCGAPESQLAWMRRVKRDLRIQAGALQRGFAMRMANVEVWFNG